MMIRTQLKWISAILLMATLAAGAFLWKTNADLLPLPASLSADGSNVRKVQVMDRNYVPLTVTYQNRWNVYDQVSLHDIPHFLQQAFVVSEDRRFYQHQALLLK